MTLNDKALLGQFKKKFLELVVDTHIQLEASDDWFLRTFDKMMSLWNERLKELK